MRRILITVLTIVCSFYTSTAQTTDTEVQRIILAKDSLFWKAYNICDVGGMAEYLAPDVEFYHDRGGAITGLLNLRQALEQGLCGNTNTRIRRESLPQTFAISILKRGSEIYGAILSGEHVFYVLQPGKSDRLDGRAKFTHLWLLSNGTWKMSRILSYDHGPV